MLLLAKAYSVADLSQAYPIMRGTGPLVVPLFAVLFLGERVSAVGWVGIAVILTGIVWLMDIRMLRVSGKAAGYALAVGLTVSLRAEWERNNKPILLASVLAPSGYLLFLYAMHLAPVAVLTPIREIGTVFGTVGAVLLLKEAQGRKRIASSVLITLGIVVLGVWA
jgi:multidrug transporter EmrE-like cation transporter